MNSAAVILSLWPVCHRFVTVGWGEERTPTFDGHSERSEESLSVTAEILRYAQNDTLLRSE